MTSRIEPVPLFWTGLSLLTLVLGVAIHIRHRRLGTRPGRPLVVLLIVLGVIGIVGSSVSMVATVQGLLLHG